MDKRGAIWVSAVLYMALGIIIISMVLAAGLPAVQKLKDRYTLIQTKDVMLTLDENIRTVFHEGPGSQRVVKLKIDRGTFEIIPYDSLDDYPNHIVWTFSTPILLSEPDQLITEGNLGILTSSTAIENSYDISLALDYTGSDVALYYGEDSTASGTFSLVILNEGIVDDFAPDNIKINLERI
jgi:hypothetical protein